MMENAAGRLSRRQAISRVANLGVGAFTVLKSELGSVDVRAQLGRAQPVPPAPDPRYPKPPTWGTELKEIAPNVYSYVQAGGPGKDNVSISNAGLIIGDDGLMIIDALAAPMHAKSFIAAIRRVTEKPFRHLINTHHHGDHVGGNQYFEGAEIVGHPYCREEVIKMTRNAQPLWAKREGWADGTEPRKVLPPVTTFDAKTTYYYGKNAVEVFPMLPAHTWGDMVVHLPQHKILFAGYIAFYYVAPFLPERAPVELDRHLLDDRQDARHDDCPRPRPSRRQARARGDAGVPDRPEARGEDTLRREDDRGCCGRRHPDGQVRQLGRSRAHRHGHGAALRRIRGDAQARRECSRDAKATEEYNAAKKATER